MGDTAITILSSVPDDVATFTGQAVCVGMRNRSLKFLTLMIETANFRGIVEIDGTLSTEPGPGDWFPVIAPLRYPRIRGETGLQPAFVSGAIDPVEPRRITLGLVPPHDTGVGSQAQGETSRVSLSLKIDLVWIRARITRGAPWLMRPELAASSLVFGTVQNITCI